MDPWWNPAVERQAQDRIHRIGQYKPIRIVRFVIENTIEERILRLQEKKELVFEGDRMRTFSLSAKKEVPSLLKCLLITSQLTLQTCLSQALQKRSTDLSRAPMA
ncbi:hypothetical protein ACLOJK_016849 [Asimina triloba]